MTGVWSEIWPPASNFTEEQLSEQTGRVPYKLAYKSPLCGPCGRNEGFLGGLISKGDLYASCIVR